jgi:hypothetical protein
LNCKPTPATIATCRPGSTASHACRPEADISFLTRILFAAYFLEAGLILVVAPWSGFWDRNLFLYTIPSLQQVLASPFARGAVSGVGAITVVAGLAELSGMLSKRSRPNHEPPRAQP